MFSCLCFYVSVYLLVCFINETLISINIFISLQATSSALVQEAQKEKRLQQIKRLKQLNAKRREEKVSLCSVMCSVADTSLMKFA